MQELGPAERELVAWIQKARRDAGLGPLRLLPELMAAARAKCEEMAAEGVIAHAGRRWPNPRRLQEAFGVRARVLGGENLAAYRDHRYAFHAWMASPDHRANILHPEHDALGVAVLPLQGPGGGIVACLEFAGGICPAPGRTRGR